MTIFKQYLHMKIKKCKWDVKNHSSENIAWESIWLYMMQSARKKLQCEICEKNVMHQEIYWTINVVKKGLTNMICEADLLWFHDRQVQTAEKNIPCSECEKKLTNIASMKLHMHIHTLEKRYMCNTCERQFTFKNNLTQHLQVKQAGVL